MFSADQALLLEKLETTYKVDSLPIAGSNAILSSNLSIVPIDGNRITRNFDKGTTGSDPDLLVETHVSMTFDFELAFNGSSAPYIEPAWTDTIQSCGFDVDNGGGGIDYTITDFGLQDAMSSVTSYLNFSGQEHIALGCRGGWSIKMPSSGIPIVSVNRKGIYVDPASVPIAVADFSGWGDPVAVDFDNTVLVQLFGYDCKMFDLEINSGITPQIINIPNEESVRTPALDITGKMIIAAPDIATENDFFSVIRSGVLGSLRVQHDNTVGDMVTLSSDAVQITNASYGNIKDVLTLELDLKLTGNDFKINLR